MTLNGVIALATADGGFPWDGQAIAYSEREREFTFAKKERTRVKYSDIPCIPMDGQTSSLNDI